MSGVTIQQLPFAESLGPGSLIVADDPGRSPSTVAFEAGVVESIWGGAGLAYTVDITAAETFVRAFPTTAPLPESSSAQGTGGVLSIDKPGVYFVQANACISMADQSKQIRMRIAKQFGPSWSTLQTTCARTSVGGTPATARVASLATHTVIGLVAGDELLLAFANWSGTQQFTLTNLQLTAIRIR